MTKGADMTATDPAMTSAHLVRYLNLKSQAIARTNDVRCYVDGGLRAALDAFEDRWTDRQREHYTELALRHYATEAVSS
jgi:hypothetical protein